MQRKLSASLAVSLALMAALMVGSAWAQESSQTLEMTPSRDSGVSGTATLTETDKGVEVTLDMKGLPKDSVEHLAHIHEGATCADDRSGNGGEVEFPLANVVADGDTGTSTMTVDTTFDELFSGDPYYVNIHAEQTDPDAVPVGVACADLEMTSGGGSSEDLSDTGGPSPLALLAMGGGALVILGATVGYVARRRLA
jgi:Cu/Zn superoxide dismutase